MRFGVILTAAVAAMLVLAATDARGRVVALGCPGSRPARVDGRTCARSAPSRRSRGRSGPGLRVGARLPATGPGVTGTTEHADIGIGSVFGPVFGSIGTKILDTIVGWVADGAAAALRFTAHLISETTTPDLESSWFSASYWRVAALASLLTVPFLCAAAVHALVRSDIGLLARAAFGYLPLAMLGVGIAAPLTTLVLSATDEMSAFVAAASGNADATFLGAAAASVSAASIIAQDPFLAFFAGLVTVVATMALWVELVIRAAAVEVIVLMLPLFFAAMVWPARRVWAIRSVETLFAIILSKFAIVSVLALGGSAIAHATTDGPVSLITGATLVILAVLTPWALLRILPVHEIAAAAVGGLSAAPKAAVGTGVGMLLPRGLSSAGDVNAAGGGDLGDVDSDITRRLGSARPERSVTGPSAAEDASSFDSLTAAGLAAVEGSGGGAHTAGTTTEGSIGAASVPTSSVGDDDAPRPAHADAVPTGAGDATADGRPPLHRRWDRATPWRDHTLGPSHNDYRPVEELEPHADDGHDAAPVDRSEPTFAQEDAPPAIRVAPVDEPPVDEPSLDLSGPLQAIESPHREVD
jgi:hypothetical protein